jgi:WD40 repeat protein
LLTSFWGAGNNGALVWDPVAGDCKAVLASEEKSSTRWAKVARNGELLITCCADRTVHVWDLQMGKLLRTLPCKPPGVAPFTHVVSGSVHTYTQGVDVFTRIGS